MTQAALIDKYGFRLSSEQLADVLGVSLASLYNMMSKGELKIKTYKEGHRRFYPYDAVAEYLDERARNATVMKAAE